MRNSDFSRLVDARTGQRIVLRDPLNIGIVNNQIPRQFLSEQSTAFLKYTPLPNTSVGAFNYINTPRSAVATQDTYTYRVVDHNLTPKDLLAFRHVWNSTKEKGTPYWGNDVRDNDPRTHNLTGTYTRTFTSAVVNEFRFGWNDMTEEEIFGTTGKKELDIAGEMKLPLVSRLPVDVGPPSIAITAGGLTFKPLEGIQKTAGSPGEVRAGDFVLLFQLPALLTLRSAGGHSRILASKRCPLAFQPIL